MTVPMETRRGQLVNLLNTLEDLIAVLELDPQCTWIDHFQQNLNRGRLLVNTNSQEELNSFSVSVVSVYGGMGSFNDYCPSSQYERNLPTDRIHRIENLDIFSSAVYDRAIELRVVGHR